MAKSISLKQRMSLRTNQLLQRNDYKIRKAQLLWSIDCGLHNLISNIVSIAHSFRLLNADQASHTRENMMQEKVVAAPTGGGATTGSEDRQLIRSINWKGAFWIASGIPAAFLFSIGGIAGTTGKLAFLVWMISITMGFFQSFTYAEMAGMFANKSGGASVYGATAWIRYSKLVAPLSVWCNWFAWSPVLSLGCAIAAAYLLNAFAPIPAVDAAAVQQWVSAHAGTALDAQRITEWLAANAGKTAADAQQTLLQADAIAALTPSIRTWELASFDIFGLASAHLNATFFIGGIDADHICDPASRSRGYCRGAEADRHDRDRHNCSCRRHSHSYGQDRLEQFRQPRAACRSLFR